jgi:hypothetical protein
MQQLLFTLPIMAIAIGFTVWNMRRSRAALANMGPMFLTFFEQTGYRNPDMPTAPLPVQAEAAAQKYRAMFSGGGAGGDTMIAYVRDMNGLPLRHHMSYRHTAEGYSMAAGWELGLPRQPRAGWHIAEKRFGSVGLKVKEAFTNVETVWSAAYPNRVSSGDPEIDGRFQCYATDPGVIPHLLAQPGFKAMLMACVEVDLRVLPDRVTFSDPTQRNLSAGMGGAVGAMAAGFDTATLMQATIPVHTRICDLVYLSAAASA